MYSPKVQMPGLGEQSLNGIYLRLDTTNDPLTGELGIVDGDKTLPGIHFGDDTDTGIYSSANATMNFSVNGLDFVKIQRGPDRFYIGGGADSAVIDTTFQVEDVDAGIKLNRTIAAESFIATLVQDTGGGQMRGMISGGLRWTDGSLVELMRMTSGSNAALSVNTATATAHLHAIQPAASTLDVFRLRDNNGRNFQITDSNILQLGLSDTGIATERDSIIQLGRGNSGNNNNEAMIAQGNGSGSTFANFISSHHNASTLTGNMWKFWTNNLVSDADFTTAGDRIIAFAAGGGRMAVGRDTVDAALQVEGTMNAFGDLDDETDYHLVLRNPAEDTGEGVGLGFAIDDTVGLIGASIIFERTGAASQGNLHFYTKQVGGFADPSLVLTLQNNGVTYPVEGQRGNITESSAAAYSVLVTDYHVSYQRSSAGVGTLTLPAISSTNHGQEYHLKDAGYNASVNNITVNTTGADTIENAASGTLTNDGESWTVIANNTTKDWEVQ